MKETELNGEINQKVFKRKLKEISGKHGKPEYYKRTSFVFLAGKGLDTRVRITNGLVEIMQKKTLAKNKSTRTKLEIPVNIQNTKQNILNCVNQLLNLFAINDHPNKTTIIAQTENYIWTIDGCEIKLSHLFGKDDHYYNFEIEKKNKNGSISKVMKKLDLEETGDFYSEKSKAFRRYNVVLNLQEMTSKEIEKIIEESLMK